MKRLEWTVETVRMEREMNIELNAFYSLKETVNSSILPLEDNCSYLI